MRLAYLEGGEAIEVGIIGSEGMVGMPLILGADRAPAGAIGSDGRYGSAHQSGSPEAGVQREREVASLPAALHAGALHPGLADGGVQRPPFPGRAPGPLDADGA